MQAYDSVDKILDFAIQREEEAYYLYTNLSGTVKRSDMKALFLQFAEEEKRHEAKLLGVKQGKMFLPVEKQVLDLKVGDYLVAEEAEKGMSYQKALVLAMKKEKASFRLYNDLAVAAPSEDLRATFISLAQEEARHKLRFEIEYDNEVLREA